MKNKFWQRGEKHADRIPIPEGKVLDETKPMEKGRWVPDDPLCARGGCLHKKSIHLDGECHHPSCHCTKFLEAS